MDPRLSVGKPGPGWRSALWLAGGSLLVFLTFMRFSVPQLGWVAFAPFLVYLHEHRTPGEHVAVLLALVVGFLAAVSKMATAEIPWAPPVPMFAVPLALSYFVAVTLAALAHRRLGVRWGIWAFASAATALGWIQYTFTPGSSWGALAHTQLDDLALMQLAAVTGVGGITFLVALGSALAAATWSRGLRAVRLDAAAFVVLLFATTLFGQMRLAHPPPGTPVRVAAVVSPVTHVEFRAARTEIDTLRRLDDELFARTARAADLGAHVVIWNEMSTVVGTADERVLAARGQALARERGVMLLMAYGVVTSTDPFRDLNKYRIYLPDGTMADEYIKRHPVPGDPDQAGRAHAHVVAFGGVSYSGAICYDYGFPGIALDNARDGADLALVPSSDWRGIDPEHGRMALLNAVAVGLPMVRPVRAATSFASDQYGRILGSMRADSTSEGVLVVDVPAGRVSTFYTKTGDVLPLLALAFSVGVTARVLLRRRHGTSVPGLVRGAATGRRRHIARPPSGSRTR